LLDVAVGRARRVGKGGDITRYPFPPSIKSRDSPVVIRFYTVGGLVKISILNPWLTDAQGSLVVFRELFEKLESYLLKMIEDRGLRSTIRRVSPGLLPPDLQIALKKVLEAVAVADSNLNTNEYDGVRDFIGSLLVTCDPRPVRIEVGIEIQPSRRTRYTILYSCKSHKDDELEMWITFWVRED
jgi:hypothetical protein